MNCMPSIIVLASVSAADAATPIVPRAFDRITVQMIARSLLPLPVERLTRPDWGGNRSRGRTIVGATPVQARRNAVLAVAQRSPPATPSPGRVCSPQPNRRGGTPGSPIQTSVTRRPPNRIGPTRRRRIAPARAASLQPAFGPGTTACCRQPQRRASRPEAPGTGAAAPAMSSQVTRAGNQIQQGRRDARRTSRSPRYPARSG